MNVIGFWIDFVAVFYVACSAIRKVYKKIASPIFQSWTWVQNSKICDKSQDMVTEDADADNRI